MANFFLEIFNLSIAACWLIGAIIIVRAVFAKSMPKWLVCCLWSLVAVRLLLPVTLESNISLVPNQQLELYAPSESVGEGFEFTEESVPVSEEMSTDTAVSSPVINETVSDSVIDEAISDFVAEDEELSTPIVDSQVSEGALSSKPIIEDNEAIGGVDVENGVTEEQNTVQSTINTDEAKESNKVSQRLAEIASIVWVVGFCLMFLYSAVSYILLKKRVAMSFPCGDRVRKGEGVESPFIFGLFRPRIYIPLGLSARTEECVIAHERAHMKRRDYLIKPIAFLILSVYWFNPLVWVAYILLCRDIEYACDEKVIEGLDTDARKAYAFALLECAVAHKRITACPVAFGETGVKERVKNTMKYKKPAFWIIIVSIIVCISVAVLFLTTGVSNGENSGTSTEDSESSETLENDIYSQVEQLINDEKYEEAYKLLLTVKSEQKAKDMLKDFIVVCETESQYDHGNLGDSLVYETKSEYDKNGNLIKQTEYNWNGVVEKTMVMTYDENNNMLSKENLYGEGESPKFSVEYTYDSNGWLIKETHIDFVASTPDYKETYEYVYDSYGNVVEKRTTHAFGLEALEIDKYILKYDENGRLIEKYHEEFPEYITYYTYYDNGILKKEYSEGWLWLKEYDENGNIIKSDTGDEVDEYTYNADGLLLKHIYNEGGDITVFDYTYDENGFLVEKVCTNSDVGVTTWKYENDEYGNPEKLLMTYNNDENDAYVFYYSGYKYFYRPQKESVIIGSNPENNNSNEVSNDESTDESNEVSNNETSNDKETKYIDGLFTAEFVKHADLGNYENCIRFDRTVGYNQFPILFTPKTTVYDFKIYNVEDLLDEVILEELLFETEIVSVDNPLLADIEIPDVCAMNAICFTDDKGKTHYYKITDSGYDGSLIVSKVTPVSSGSNSETAPELPHVHTYGAWQIIVDATCEGTGVKERKCSCGDVEIASIGTRSHNYIEGVCSCGMVDENYLKPIDGELTFKAVSGGYAVSGYSGTLDEVVVIPETYNGLPVVEISDNVFSSKRGIKKVVIPSSVKRIGDYAFLYCFDLSVVEFGANSKLQTIGGGAFNSTDLISITLPEGLTTIGDGAFNGCDYLTEISIPSTLKSIGSNAFRYSTSITKVIVADLNKWSTVSFDGKYANPAFVSQNIYSKDSSLVTNVEISQGTTEISKYAFYGITSIESVSIPSSVKNIGEGAFGKCKTLQIYITDIASWSQMNVASDESLPAFNLYLNGNLVKELTIPSSVKSVGNYAFEGCYSLTNVIVPNTVISVGEGAFMNCKSLGNITLSSRLTELPKNILNGNINLKSFVIPKNVTYIGDNAFYSCSSVTSFFIPESVTYIGEDAFEGCSSVNEFEFEVKEGWVCAATAGDRTIRASDLSTSYNTIAKVNDYNFAPWVRRY